MVMELFEPPTCFVDHRGIYVETWNSTLYGEWKQDCTSISPKRVLRGLHGDNRGCEKLVTCLLGSIFVAIADPRTKKAAWHVLTLCNQQILVPAHCALGHLVLSDVAVFHYKQSQLYDRASQFTIKWDDPEYAIPWPIWDPILSERDSNGPFSC